MLSTQSAWAFSSSIYPQESVLSSGKWVKISTSQQGVHRIDAATLSSWGFNDASQVSLYGYNGYMLPETFSTTHPQDLQPLPVYVQEGALYFYSSGVREWSRTDEKYWAHENNYYSNHTYYFLTDSRAQIAMDNVAGRTVEGTPLTTFDERYLYENDYVCIGNSGSLYMGENLLNDTIPTITLPDVMSDEVTAYISIGAKSAQKYSVTTTCNETELSPKLAVNVSDTYTHLQFANGYFTIDTAESYKFSFDNPGNFTQYHLDYIRFFYKRALALNQATLHFRCNDITNSHYSIDPSSRNAGNIKVWNVTNVNNPFIQQTSIVDNKVVFNPQGEATDCLEFVAFDIKDNSIPAPQLVGNVKNQNLHGTDIMPEMVIVTTKYFMEAAEQLAQLHREHDNMDVLVCDQIEIFNEFSYGMPDATAIRRFMKMLYDRGMSKNATPKYLLMYGRSYYNLRYIEPTIHNDNNKLLISYLSKPTIDIRHTYITDDYFAYLGDNTGKDLTMEEMVLGVGRISVRDIDETQMVYNKLSQYIQLKPSNNLWKNKTSFIGMYGDNNLHIRQIDKVARNSIERNQKHMILNKIYMNAYNSTSTSKYIGAQEQVYRDLEEGALILNYMGHADARSIGRGLMNIYEVKEMDNQYWPVFITATCDVAAYDEEEFSIGEALFCTDKGGFIALFTTTGTVYTTGNENINIELMNEIFSHDAHNKVRLGDVMRRAKNNLIFDASGYTKDPNKLKYVLIGDPALALPIPSHTVTVESINSNAIAGQTIVEVKANGSVVIDGTINDKNGNVASNFDGVICYEVYDALVEAEALEVINTPTGNFDISEKFTYRPYKLTTAADSVTDGKFSTTIHIPEVCLQSDTTLLISFYAYNNDKSIEAWGYSNNIVVNGVDTLTETPHRTTIENMWVGDETFLPGDVVSNNTTLHCELNDNGYGLSTNELTVGKNMILILDDKIQCNDLAGYFTSKVGEGGGYIDYPLHNLGEGKHNITVKVFDNAGNSTESTVSFIVSARTAGIYNVTIDEDPILTQATISLDGEVTSDMNIRYVIAHKATGKEVWTTQSNATQVVWNIETNEGTIHPDEYVCYAIVSVDGENIVTPSKKLIVLGQ